MRERAGWLIFLPEPCDFDQNAPTPAVAGLGYSLAPRRRSAVIGARCKTEIRSQLPSAGEGSGEHLASKDCRAGGAHSVQRDEQLSLLFDHRVLRVGRVAFLLNLTKLGRDQGEASVFAFEFATQPIWQRMTFRGLEGGKVDPSPAQLRLDVPDTLCKQQSLDAIDVARAFPDETLALPMRTASIFFLNRGHADYRTDVAFSPIGRDQGTQERQHVDAGCASRITASAAPRSMRCTPLRSSASARGKRGRPTSSAARYRSPPRPSS